MPWRLLALAATLLIAAYLALCLWMHLNQRRLIYFPQFTRIAPAATDFELRRDGLTLRGWRLHPGHPHALIYFGGNAESLLPMRDALQTVPGYTTYLLAYRGYGASEGEPGQTALVEDAVALYDHVRGRHPGTLAVIGRSLGSGVAAELAARRPVDRLVLVTPFDSLAAVARHHYPWLPMHRLLRDRYDSAQALGEYRGRVLIVSAQDDALIPAARTRALIDALPEPPRHRILPGAGHNFDPHDGDFLDTVVRFLQHDGARSSRSPAGS